MLDVYGNTKELSEYEREVISIGGYLCGGKVMRKAMLFVLVIAFF